MAKMSLYQAERPHAFSDVKGQNEVVTLLQTKFKKFVSDGYKLNNTNFLLVGPAGTGKTTLARIIAESLNCTESADGEPCGECASCKAIRNGSSQDVIELDAASHNGVEDIRRLIESCNFAPVGRYKVFILDECHMLSTGASNALLKTLEEPPQNVAFILATTEEDKVLDTIKSRCQILHLESISVDVIQSHLRDVCDKYGKCYEDSALALIAKHSGGALRSALSILESLFDVDGLTVEAVAKKLGITGEDIVFDVLDGVLGNDAKSSLLSVQKAVSSGKGVKGLVKEVLSAINDLEAVSLGLSLDDIVNTSLYKERLEKTVALYDENIIGSFVAGLRDVLSVNNMDAELYMELAIRSSLRRIEKENILEDRVKKLEDRVRELESGTYVKSESTKEDNKTAAMENSEPVEDASSASTSPNDGFEVIEDEIEEPAPVENKTTPEVASIEGINADIEIEDDLEDLFKRDFEEVESGAEIPELTGETQGDVIAEADADTKKDSVSETLEDLEKQRLSKVEEAVSNAQPQEEKELLPDGTQAEVISASDFFGEDFAKEMADKPKEESTDEAVGAVSGNDTEESLSEAFNGWLW